jgi:phosphate transport system permease protein
MPTLSTNTAGAEPSGGFSPASAATVPASRTFAALPPPRTRRIGDRVVEFLLLLAAILGVFITSGIVYVLAMESAPFFRHVSLSEFFTSTRWSPQFADAHYGVLPLISGTLTTTLIALIVAMPIGSLLAIWLCEFAPARLREIVKPVLELLAAVPTVVYGYFAVQAVSPALHRVLGAAGIELPTFNMLSAGLVMGVMIIPYVSSLSEDAMRAVPMLLREGSYGMGANRLQTALRVVFPSALSGIAAAYVLAISRAVGETMIVAVAAGQQPRLTLDPTEQAATITAYIVQVSMGDQPHGTIGYQSIFAAGATLFVMTFGFNLAGAWLRRRFREVY